MSKCSPYQSTFLALCCGLIAGVAVSWALLSNFKSGPRVFQPRSVSGETDLHLDRIFDWSLPIRLQHTWEDGLGPSASRSEIIFDPDSRRARALRRALESCIANQLVSENRSDFRLVPEYSSIVLYQETDNENEPAKVLFGFGGVCTVRTNSDDIQKYQLSIDMYIMLSMSAQPFTSTGEGVEIDTNNAQQ